MSDLKPCPFCPDGGEPQHIMGSSFEYGNREHAVECCKCGVVGPVRGTEAEAIEAWNTRYERITRIVQGTKGMPLGESIVYPLACEACGCGISAKDSYCRSCGARVKEDADAD